MGIGLHSAMFFRHSAHNRHSALQEDEGKQFELAGALAVASSLAECLRDVHRRSELHQAICLSNVRMDENGVVELRNDTSAPLCYMSPEQTGRMNRTVDYRSDYYSMGIVFYELFVGRLPFVSDNVMELVHSHIARMPKAPLLENPELPVVVSDLIMKLLAKNAEDRYQSLDGLLSDLAKCQVSLAETGAIEPFVLASGDVSDRLMLPQKLYGRENEVEQLVTTFNRAASGRAEILLVTGYSGIGKSSLVNEIHKPVVARQGYFVSGKFDQFKRNIPYSAINDAFRELTRQILTESESRIAVWKEKLVKALGQNGQMMVDAIPELEYIIGKQPEAPNLNAARNSYNYVMQNFVGVFTRREHPLVLFLDDLQWADAASLKLINVLMKGLDDPCLLLIGAYRSNEVEATHSLMIAMEEISKEVPVGTIDVKALSLENITSFVADAVAQSQHDAAPLAHLIYQKTLGNPFFVGQFLKSLYHEHLLKFEGVRWQWNIADIEALGITDNVVDLLTKDLARLAAQTQRLLTLAACIGNGFDIKTLATVGEQSPEEIKDTLQQAIRRGLVRVSEIGIGPAELVPGAYYFLHDRVQQAAYEGIPQNEKQAVHLKIGRLLLNSVSAAERSERIFDIVFQLNEGRDLLTTVEERNLLAELNLVAAKKARSTAAFDVHRTYTEIAWDAGGAREWRTSQAFMHELYMELIAAAFARADYTEMEQLCNIVSDNSASAKEAIAAKEMLIRCYGALYQPKKLMKTGIELLALSGIVLPANLGARHIWLAEMKLRLALRGKDPLDLLNLPRATDAQYLLQLQATTTFLGYGLTYLAGSNVVLWVAMEMVRKSIVHGVSPHGAYAYAVLARTLSGKLGQPALGYKFGKVSATLGDEKHLLGAVGIYHGIIRHRREHLRLSLQPLMDTYVKAMEIGDRAGAVVALQFSDAIRFQSGCNVSESLTQIRKDINIYKKMDYSALLGVMIPWAILFADLAGESVADITQGASIESYALARKKAEDSWGVFYVLSIQCINDYYFGRNEAAFANAAEAISLPGFDYGTPASAYLMFIYSLAQLNLRHRDKHAAKAAAADVARMQRRFDVWASNAPMNYMHKWQLVEAERWRILGKADKATQCYDLAINGARANDFPGDEALAHELAGRFYLEAGKELTARIHMEEAYAKYEEWGAFAKARDLEDRYRKLLVKLIDRKRIEATRILASVEQRLDADTIIKASQTLSGEIQLDKLLEKLMRLLIKNAGAQKGVLLLQTDGALFIQATALADTIEVLQDTPAEGNDDLNLSVINYVKRTREKVVIGNAADDTQFNVDSYVHRMNTKSVMCIPLQKQRELVGILYLENNLAVDAFTAEHTELLEMLSTQIAISLENASLYNELEQKIEVRTKDLSQKNEQLVETLSNLKLAQKKLVEAEKLASLGQLVAGVAHEINTPVGVAVTGASTLAEETASLAALYNAGTMKRSDLDTYVGTATTISKLLLSNMERAATLIQSFKEVAIDQTSEERRKFSLKPYIDEVLLNLSPMLRKTEHQVVIVCDMPIEVDTYPGAVSQIVTNFVMNAMLHAFAVGQRGTMAITARGIDADTVELRFADDGRGIAAENLPRIFDPFFTTMRGRGGSGLGLNIIHNLVTASLQGQIAVESTIGVGTTFIVSFPRNPAKAPAAAIIADNAA